MLRAANPSTSHVSDEEPARSRVTSAGWLCLWFRRMAVSAVAEMVRPIGPKAGGTSQRPFSLSMPWDRRTEYGVETASSVSTRPIRCRLPDGKSWVVRHLPPLVRPAAVLKRSK
ncbi:hypothetical protein BT67DRAFT_240608 [Trichocladium antarcticum]|uniref:Uncharacterized protein n=1 Tax=Trichocladium antarcticum TaxID=1450529 RepID=A0AAN6ZAE6_9PEZI|nr:hypothetical protein BT67DRAFT_240608 [Trichocladium antarcticum]